MLTTGSIHTRPHISTQSKLYMWFEHIVIVLFDKFILQSKKVCDACQPYLLMVCKTRIFFRHITVKKPSPKNLTILFCLLIENLLTQRLRWFVEGSFSLHYVLCFAIQQPKFWIIYLSQTPVNPIKLGLVSVCLMGLGRSCSSPTTLGTLPYLHPLPRNPLLLTCWMSDYCFPLGFAN